MNKNDWLLLHHHPALGIQLDCLHVDNEFLKFL